MNTKADGAIAIVLAVGDAIRELKEVPSGHLYGMMMPTGITLAGYEKVIDTLTQIGVVSKAPSGMLKWIGPAKQEVPGG